MKKLIIAIALTLVAIVNVNGQEVVSNLNLTGLTVKIEKGSKFSYKSDSNTEIKIIDGTLNAKSLSDNKSTLTIYMPGVSEISAVGCTIEIESKVDVKDLNLDLSKGSVLTMNDVKASKVLANLSESSRLRIGGSVKNLSCNLHNSLLESADIRTTELTINAINNSVATMKINAIRTEANASLSSGITLRGYSETLKCAGESSSKIIASQLEVRRAQATNIGNSEVAVNATQLIADKSVKNLHH